MRPVFHINSPLRKEERSFMRRNATPEEKLLWKHIQSKQLGFWFKRQVSIGPYFLDFYCPTKHLAIEIDGSQHQKLDNQQYDKFRTEYLGSFNIIVLRFKNSEILNDLPQVIVKIKSNLISPP